MKDRNSRMGSTLESLLREDGFYEDVETEAIASVLAYKRRLARAELNGARGTERFAVPTESARRALSLAGSGERQTGDSESERAGGVREKHELLRVKVPERESETGAYMDGNGDLRRLAELVDLRNANEREIAELIGRPGQPGHVGEFIAARIFDIDLEPSANKPGYDGRFGSGPLAQKSVDVKYYSKWEAMLDINIKHTPDYYLVLAGPKSAAASSKGASRSWAVDNVFLFEAKPLIGRLRKRGVKIGTATSVRSNEWEAARIYPVPVGAGKSPVTITKTQRDQIGMFGSAIISWTT